MAIVSGLAAAAVIAGGLLVPFPLSEPGAGSRCLAGQIGSPSPDEDSDGIPDPADHCPGTTRGFAVDSDGCELDQDADGVADGADRCPDTRPGALRVEEPVGPDGCSVRDEKKERPFPFSTQVG